MRFIRVVAIGFGVAVPTTALAAGTPLEVEAAYTSDSFATLSGVLSTGFRHMGLLELMAEPI